MRQFFKEINKQIKPIKVRIFRRQPKKRKWKIAGKPGS